MNMHYNKKIKHILALIIAVISAFYILDAWKTNVIIKSDELNELVQLPLKIQFIYFLQDNALFEIIQKTSLLANLYGDSFHDKLVKLQPFENVVRAVESAYAEYSMVEGYQPSRVRLAMKTKPMVYAELLKNYPILLAQVPVRSNEISDRYGII